MWEEGFWKFTINGHVVKILEVDGDEIKEENGDLWMKLKAGTYSQKLENFSCNLEFFWVALNKTGHGVLTGEGKKILLDNGGFLDWLDEEEKNSIINDKDPADDIPNNYPSKPNQVGKILWLCGSTGMGKTTTAKLLQEEHGFIYYEGDCFTFGLNPYVGAAPKGSSHFGTRALAGITAERTEVCRVTLSQGYTKLFKGEKVDNKVWEDFYDLLCKDVLRERAKHGGNWVVTQAVYTRAARDMIRRKIGDDLVLAVLESDETDLQVERLARRALGEGEVTEESLEDSKKKMEGFLGFHETVSKDEENTFKILVSKDMKPADVAKTVLEKY